MSSSVVKHSYTIPCSTTFRDAVEALAGRRQVNVGDLARSILLVVPETVVSAFADPGEPPTEDRETVVLKSGPAVGRPWRRKPRLQVRMPPGYDIPFVRKALGLALAMDHGAITVRVSDGQEPPPAERRPGQERRQNRRSEDKAISEIKEEVERLKAIISVLAFEPLVDGIQSREEALHILGFPPNADPDTRTLRAKYRMMATIHHPDSVYGDHRRMSQLNQAMEFLRSHAA